MSIRRERFCNFSGEKTVDDCKNRAMKKDVKTVADWDFERIIPCHGVSPAYVIYLCETTSNVSGVTRRTSSKKPVNRPGWMPTGLICKLGPTLAVKND